MNITTCCFLQGYVVIRTKFTMYSSYKVLMLGQRFNLRTVTSNLKRIHSEKSCGEKNDIEEKVVYNSVIKHGRLLRRKKNFSVDETYSQLNNQGPPVLALKYFNNEFEDRFKLSSDVSQPFNINETEKVNFPYEKHHHISFNNSPVESTTLLNEPEDNSVEIQNLTFYKVTDKPCQRPNRKWMEDYDKYTEVSVKMSSEKDEDNINVNYNFNYGSADPNISCSNVPCGGCGAHLHCQDSAIPGYLPKEVFVGLRTEQLQAVVCQRCHFLREYNTALAVSVDPEIYPELLSKIKNQNALVIMVVDMTDFPCSIWPGILDIIGPKRPLVVVGNKIDLLQDFSKDWLKKAETALVKQLPPKANLIHVSLVSAKTGYGIENLVTSLFNLWEYRGDVYLVGCTNVGKSTLFNALLQSDYCKTKAVDLIQRATTAPWPGTTLNLLKFPILRPEGYRIAMRNHRLRTQNAKDLRLIQEGHVTYTPQMISYINRTFSHGNTDRQNDDYWEDPFSLPKLETLRRLKSPGSGLDPSDPVFALSKWLYDTPGVVTPDQIIDLLTTEELILTLPREPIIPRTWQIWPGQSLLVAGLSRLDYISGPANIKMTVLAAASLPVTLCWIKDAEVVYQYYLGSEAMAVPCGGAERLKRWPGLHSGPQFVLKGDGWKQSCADVVLSSSGWIAVTAQQDSICQLQAWTPKARGIHVRIPPVLPRAIALKGTKMFRTQAYALFNKYIKDRK